MRSRDRILLVAALVCATVACSAPTAAAVNAKFGVQAGRFEASTCVVSSCTYEGVEKTPSEAFTQAAGHPQYGVTAFELNHKEELLNEEPYGALKRLRVDVPPGLAADPEALPSCSAEEFEKEKCSEKTVVGEAQLTVWLLAARTAIAGTVYNLKQPPGLPLEFGIHVDVAGLINEHIYLAGHDSWNTDYHEYFEIDNISRTVPIIKSKLIFFGRAGEGKGNFLTLPSVCANTTTSYLEVESWEGEVAKTQTHSPAGVEGCQNVPFEPSVAVRPENARSDAPDGAIAEVKVPQNEGAEQINSADVRDIHMLLPEGLTLNPPAALGLQTCTAAQIAIGQTAPVTCPAASRLGNVTIETDLPAGSLSGSVYLGAPPTGATITGPPYTIYLDAESVYGVSVRLKGSVEANPTTGRLEASFAENPELPFSDAILKLNGGARSPLANPLSCSDAPAQALFVPYTGVPPSFGAAPFAFAAQGCPASVPFALSQSAQSAPPSAGASTSYTLALARADGQQYLARVRTVLPAGVVGRVPSVALCHESRASEGTCPSSSQIGTASVGVGAGPEPVGFSGPVFLTGPYGGAPYGLSVAVPAKVGVFDLGGGACDCVVTRASVAVDPYTGRVIVTSALPTIVKGVPLRLRSLSVAIDRPGFLLNPTNCAALSTETTLTSTFGAPQSLASPFQVSGCAALPFKPKLTASTKAKTSRAIGAALKTKITIPPGMQANLKSVFVQLPKQLPARTSTLNLACREATFNANPFSCPPGAYVGTAIVDTPVLPEPLRGSAVLVSHGGRAFPDLDLLLSGDGGVNVILVGHTNIVKNVTSSDFASLPDVPVSSVELKLPQGKKSALGAVDNLCRKPLLMPTTITGQNGRTLVQRTRIAVAGCPHRHHRHRHRRTRDQRVVHKGSR